MVTRIKHNDLVMVISGKDRKKTGIVLDVCYKTNKVLVKDVALVTRHVKARQQGGFAGIKREESYIALSKVMPMCPATKKPCRVGSKVAENGKRVRISVRSQASF